MKIISVITSFAFFFPMISMASSTLVITTSSIDPTYKLLLLNKINSEHLSLLLSTNRKQPSVKHLLNEPNNINIAYSNRVTSARQAGQLVKSRYGGKILSIYSSNSENGNGYRVKLVDKKGKVLTVFVNAASGRIIQL